MPINQKTPSAPTASRHAASTLKTHKPAHRHRKSRSSIFVVRHKSPRLITIAGPLQAQLESEREAGSVRLSVRCFDANDVIEWIEQHETCALTVGSSSDGRADNYLGRSTASQNIRKRLIFSAVPKVERGGLAWRERARKPFELLDKKHWFAVTGTR